GKLFGRGTTDMKSFIAIALALVPAMRARPLHVPIHLAFSYDEEVGCLSVSGLIDLIRRQGVRPRAVIVGEPTEMKVVNAHKGIRAFLTTVTGLESHSSTTHRGANAILFGAELIAALGRMADEQAASPGDPRFDPPYTTIHVGTVRGGTALNIVPRECSFLWEYREVPGDDGRAIERRFRALAEGDVLARLRARFAGATIETRQVAEVPPLAARDGSPAETLALALAGSNRTAAVSYATEAGLFDLADLPAVVCGPGCIDQAHRPDEFITLEQVAAGEAFLRRLIAFAASPSA
ncbi:MAG: M20/M25/M40 family metallo-hydrolase, partial [Alphaproteobacteria bacterium]|nr:M20/M25/M40 family metallo-hydrolase [Alphaproteobacteria bacterium]